MLRQQVRPTSRIHGIVTHGGAAPNIIPEFAAATFYIRAAELDYLARLKKRVIACAEAAATATGATVKVTELEAAYEPLRRNDALLDAFRANWRALGVQESEPPKDRYGSSDVGNVSQVVPTIQPLVKIAREGTPIHSRAFEKAAVTPMAREGLLKAAKIMAMTTADLLGDQALLGRVRRSSGLGAETRCPARCSFPASIPPSPAG